MSRPTLWGGRRPQGHLITLIAAIGCALCSVRADAALHEVLAISGPYDLSIDGAGSSTTNDHTLTLQKPSETAALFAVYATVTGVWGKGDPGVDSLVVAGVPVSLEQVAVSPDDGLYTRYGDITAEVGAYFDALPAGVHGVPISEAGVDVDDVDGAALYVVWEDATLPVSTVALAFASEVTSDTPSFTLTTHPLDVDAPGFAATVGVGISFSTGDPNTGQQSSVTLNGALLYDRAGGYDDGGGAAGALFTIGGDGDATDAERYDGTPHLADGDTELTLALSAAYGSDYLFAVWMKVTAAGLAGVDTCGDYAVTGAEECDDGNFVDGDGCSAQCKDEDRDHDGLSNDDEAVHGTDPDVPDTDGDGLLDGEEVLTHETDPTDADSDDDGLSDGAEVNDHGTDPNDADTDDGGVRDGDEIVAELDPLDPSDDDPDGDGLTNGEEDALGTDRDDADSDDDGLTDGAEVNDHGTNPLSADSDDDGLDDGSEIGTHGTDPTDADSDDDGLNDGAEVETHGTDPNDDDSDGDGLSDGAEIDTHGTDPNNQDTDGAGVSDGQEVENGTDPLDPSDDVPASPDDDNNDGDGDGDDDGDGARGVPDTGCGCSSSGGDSASLGALLFALAFLHRRRRTKT